MFSIDEDRLNRAITALQAIAAHPDAADLADLQAIIRRELSSLPVPRYHPDEIDIRTADYHPRHFPPELRELDHLLATLDTPDPADNLPPTCVTCGCVIPCA